jgi:FkbM family methyltransferase
MESGQEYKILNFRMYLQDFERVISERLRKRGIWEPSESIIARRHIKHGDVVVDVGAHIGYFTLLFAHQTGETGKVYAFEPDPLNMSLLGKNVGLNRIKQVELVGKAVSNTDSAAVKLYQTGETTGHHSLVKTGETTDIIDVEQVRLDSFFEEGERVDFVKIDTEGNEGNVLMGMNRVIADNPQIKLMMEFSQENLQGFGHTPHDIYFLLREFGFTVYVIDMRSKDLMLMEPEDVGWFLEQKELAVPYRNIFAMKEQDETHRDI